MKQKDYSPCGQLNYFALLNHSNKSLKNVEISLLIFYFHIQGPDFFSSEGKNFFNF